jgi:hypothetical protein
MRHGFNFHGLALALALAAGNLSAQPARVSKAVPSAASGKPDLSGVWQPGSTIAGNWEDANSGTGLGGTGKNPAAPVLLSSSEVAAQVKPAPYKPEAAAKVRASYNQRGVDDPAAQCLPLGVPRAWSVSLFPVEMILTPNKLVIYYEYMNLVRVIPIGPNAKHPDDVEPTYMGDSIGHWEGDTLVVDVSNFNDKTWLVGTGAFHTDALHVTERYHRISKDRIDYTAIMTDPGVLIGPWEYHQTLMLREGTRVREYVCAENNVAPDRYDDLLKNNVKFQRQ